MNEPTLTLPFFNPSGGYPPSPSSPFSETYDTTFPNGSSSSSYPLGGMSNGGARGSHLNGHRAGGNIQNLALPQGVSAGSPNMNTNNFGEPDYNSFYDPSAYLQTSPAQPPQVLPQAGPSRPISQSTSPNDLHSFVSHHASPNQSWDGRQASALGNGYGGIQADQLYLPQESLQGQQGQHVLQGEAEVDEELVDEDEDDSQEVDGEEEGQEEGGEMEDSEEPLYVNAKQYHRILKRRAARQRLDELNRLARSRKPYLHESRHRHACNRPRGKGGRFLTAEEIEALKKEEAANGTT